MSNFCLLLLACLVPLSCCFTYNRTFTTNGHSQLVTTASFFNDRQRFLTGGNDNTTKVWSLTNFTLLANLSFSDYVMNVALHPVDNRIFVAVYNGTIGVYNGTTYNLITNFLHPNANANYITFDPSGRTFIFGGFDGSGLSPIVYIYNSTDYTQIDSFSTSFPVGDEINQMSMNANGAHLAISSLANGLTVFKVEVYQLPSKALIASLTNFTDNVRWAIFDYTINYLCVTSRDQYIRCFQYNSGGNTYAQDIGWSTNSYPYCLGFGIPNTLISSVLDQIVFYNTSIASPTKYLNYTDVEPIFVMDSTPNLSHLVTGMQTGHISIWEYIPDPLPNPTPTPGPVDDATLVAHNLGLIIGLAVGVPVFAIVLAILLYCCICGRCAKLRGGWRVNVEDDSNLEFTGKNDHLQFSRKADLKDQYIIINKADTATDKSSEVDYDELMGQGTIVVIRDEDKK